MISSSNKRDFNIYTNVLNRNKDTSWGTRPYHPWKSGELVHVYESNSIDTSYTINGDKANVSIGAIDLPDGDLGIHYSLGTAKGEKMVEFTDEEINVKIDHEGQFSEALPLTIRKEDKIETSVNRFELRRGRAVMEIIFDSGKEPRLEKRDYGYHIYDIYMLTLDAVDNLNYTIRLSIREPEVIDSDRSELEQELLDELNEYLMDMQK